jgi:hypothetical protein
MTYADAGQRYFLYSTRLRQLEQRVSAPSSRNSLSFLLDATAITRAPFHRVVFL